MADVGRWLDEQGLGEYADSFAANAVDWDVLPELDDADLAALGVLLGHRKKLLRAIAALADGPAATAHVVPQVHAASQAERRQLTVMFCDLVGSTALSARLDPEDMRAVLRAYQDACSGAISRYDGYVAKFMGDGVLAYFGYPRAFENDAERAINAGLAIVEGVKGLAADGGKLAVRIGIATGTVVVGDLVGEGAAQEAAIVGETPNLAARLQALAEPDTLVIADATRRLTGDLFELADLGRHALKGLDGAVQAWRVTGVNTAASRFEATRAGRGLTPLVGREQEVELVFDRWRRAQAGEGQVVLLAGEAGIGKSRIVQALGERLAGDAFTRLRYHCSPVHTASALHPVIGQLERAAGFARGDDTATRLDKLEALLAPSTDDVATVAPLFASLLSLDVDGRYAPLGMSPEKQRVETFRALKAQLRMLATVRPVVIHFEDLHWVDPTTLELFNEIVERIADYPVLLMATHRPDFVSPWQGHAHVTALTLNRLTRSQAADIVAALSGGKVLPDEVLDQIVVKTDGVPLFVEELTKTVLESGLLRETGESYVLDGPLPALAVPSTLQDSLLARLDRLAPVKEVAQTGAVIGREFRHDLLAAVSPLDELALAAALDDLVDAGLVFRRGASPNVRYVFKHALVQDAAYESLLKTRRAQLHDAIARVLEADFPETAQSQPELLAQHHASAGDAAAAAAWWARAAKQAMARSASAEALAHVQAGLALLEQMADGAERGLLEFDLRIAQATALMTTRGYGDDQVAKSYERADSLLQQYGEAERRLPVLYGLYVFNLLRGNYQQALTWAQDILDLGSATDTETTRRLGERCTGVILSASGQPAKALPLLESARAFYVANPAEAAGFGFVQDAVVTTDTWIGYAHMQLGHPDRARRYVLGTLERAERLQHAFSLCMGLTMTFWTFYLLRQPAEDLRTFADQCLGVSDENEFRFFRLAGSMWQALTDVRTDLTDATVETLRDQAAAYRMTGADMFFPMLHAVIARSLGRLGRIDEAFAALAEGLAMPRGRAIGRARPIC